jgi:hypothetical protein
MNPELPPRIDRRLAIKWMLAAGAGALLADSLSLGGAAPPPVRAGAPPGYGVDPDLVKAHKPGEYWPLTFTDAERRAAAALCDVIIPAEGDSPSASALGVHDFIDEWISSPYPMTAADRQPVMEGLAWLDAESGRRFGCGFAGATDAQRLALCEDISRGAPEGSELAPASRFFRRFRDLASAGFYTTPAGMRDLGYVGNVPLARFDGPPAELVAKLGLKDEVRW